MSAGAKSFLIVSIVVSTGLLGAAASSAQPKPPTPPSSTHRVGLGKVVNTADGGQIFGWDINQTGSDGVLATSQPTSKPGVYKVSVETFDQQTGKITTSFAREVGRRNTYGVDGIFAGDVGLVTHYIVPKGSIFAKRQYELMNPVTAGRFTGPWTPPVSNVDVLANAENQQTSTSVVYAIELKHQDRPDLLVSDLSAGNSHTWHLNPSHFSLNNGPQLAQDTGTNRAVLASSPDGGAVFGGPPLMAMVNLTTGHVTEWNGLNNGFFHAGSVNGLAVDSATRIAATTTELNAQVEFYDLAKRSQQGIAVQLPGTGDTDQTNSGAAIASDPLHKLFLVADPVFAPTGDSAIVVYNERGHLVESIPGFHFSNRFSVVPLRVAVNPKLRMGWVDGPGINQLQQFFY